MDSAFKSAPYSAHTSEQLKAFIAEGSPNADAMTDELARRARVVAGDWSIMTNGERLRHFGNLAKGLPR